MGELPDGIRTAAPGDVDDVARLARAFAAEFDDDIDPGLEERIARFVERPQDTILLAGTPPVGYVVVRLREVMVRARPEVTVDDLFVLPEHRGQGRGRALLQGAIASARAQGAGHLELTTTEEDAAAAALYRAEGLRETETAEPDSGTVIWFGLDL